MPSANATKNTKRNKLKRSQNQRRRRRRKKKIGLRFSHEREIFTSGVNWINRTKRMQKCIDRVKVNDKKLLLSISASSIITSLIFCVCLVSNLKVVHSYGWFCVCRDDKRMQRKKVYFAVNAWTIFFLFVRKSIFESSMHCVVIDAPRFSIVEKPQRNREKRTIEMETIAIEAIKAKELWKKGKQKIKRGKMRRIHAKHMQWTRCSFQIIDWFFFILRLFTSFRFPIVCLCLCRRDRMAQSQSNGRRAYDWRRTKRQFERRKHLARDSISSFRFFFQFFFTLSFSFCQCFFHLFVVRTQPSNQVGRLTFGGWWTNELDARVWKI